MKVRWADEGTVLADGIEIGLAVDGEGMNVAGFWVDTAQYNPDNLDDIRTIIKSDAEVQMRLNLARAARDYARACIAQAWERAPK